MTRVTATLKLGAVKTDVQVSAQVSAVETSSAVTGQSLGPNTIRTLPLATQNFQQLLTLSARTSGGHIATIAGGSVESPVSHKQSRVLHLHDSARRELGRRLHSNILGERFTNR